MSPLRSKDCTLPCVGAEPWHALHSAWFATLGACLVACPSDAVQQGLPLQCLPCSCPGQYYGYSEPVVLAHEMTLQADQEFGLGVSVATISANMSSRNLAIIAQTVMSSLTLTAPRVPYNNSFFSWSDVSASSSTWAVSGGT